MEDIQNKVNYFFSTLVPNKKHSDELKSEVLALYREKVSLGDTKIAIEDIYRDYLGRLSHEAVYRSIAKYKLQNATFHQTAVSDISYAVKESLIKSYDCERGATEKTFVSRIAPGKIYDYFFRMLPPKELKPEREIELFVDMVIAANEDKVDDTAALAKKLSQKIRNNFDGVGYTNFSDKRLNTNIVNKIILEGFGRTDISIPKYHTPRQTFASTDHYQADTSSDQKEPGSTLNLLDLQIGINNKVNPVISVLKYLAITSRLTKETTQKESVTGFLSSKTDLNVVKWDLVNQQFDKQNRIVTAYYRIKGFQRHNAIANSLTRRKMIKTLEVLRVSRGKYLEEKRKGNLSLFSKNNDPNRIPLLSSVLFDRNGNVVRAAFKGETGDYNQHCEFNLFDKLSLEEYSRADSGSLYVTLEPCNKRKYILNEGKKIPKIPCAVRCARSGIKEVWIATVDPHKAVNWEGVKILRTGTYIFELNKGNIHEKTTEQVEASGLLRDKFLEWNCPILKEDQSNIIYKISEPVKVKFFHPDLVLEAMLLNREFIGEHLNAFI